MGGTIKAAPATALIDKPVRPRLVGATNRDARRGRADGGFQMRHKTMLMGAASLASLAALTLSGCATSDGQPPANAASAEAFVASAETELLDRYEYEAHVAWVFNNFITYDTERLMERVDAESTEQLKKPRGAHPFHIKCQR
jgi:hypothetical protein